jgi:pyruvate/2-oxoglutarate dehydrogenase complex dihydrolipoamide dehydrogenase (E3) component
MRNCRAQIAPHDSQERFESLGVDVFRGQAKFLSPHEVQVGDEILRAKNFVIARVRARRFPTLLGLKRSSCAGPARTTPRELQR